MPVHDNGELQNTFPDQWALLADKGYAGGDRDIRAIIPKNGNRLSATDNSRNRNIFACRIIVENFFGRLKMLWKIMHDRFRLSHDWYDKIVRICVALTNFHIDLNPLREDDRINYKAIPRQYTYEGEAESDEEE